MLRYVPVHAIPFHYLPLHSIVFKWILLHSTTFEYVALGCTTFCYVPLPFTSLSCIPLHSFTFYVTYAFTFLLCQWLYRFILREGEQDMAEDLIEPDSQDGEGNGFREGIVAKPTSTNSPQVDCSFWSSSLIESLNVRPPSTKQHAPNIISFEYQSLRELTGILNNMEPMLVIITIEARFNNVLYVKCWVLCRS